MMETIVTTIHILTAFFMILVVLIQGGNQGGVGAAFGGGGNTAGVFGAAGATSFLGKLTYGAAAIFMITSIALTVIQGGSGETGLSEKLKNQAAETKTTEPVAPVETAPVAVPVK